MSFCNLMVPVDPSRRAWANKRDVGTRGTDQHRPAPGLVTFSFCVGFNKIPCYECQKAQSPHALNIINEWKEFCHRVKFIMKRHWCMQSDIGCYSKYSEYDAGIQITLMVWLMAQSSPPRLVA